MKIKYKMQALFIHNISNLLLVRCSIKAPSIPLICRGIFGKIFCNIREIILLMGTRASTLLLVQNR